MAPLDPLNQQIFEEGPKSSVGMGSVTPFVYQETYPILPAPINPNIAVTDQQAWYKLGAEAFNIAGKLYEEVLDYQISGQEANIQALTFDLEDKINDASAAAEIRILNGTESQNQIAKDMQDFYSKEKETFKNKAIEILGQSSYDYYIGENSDISLLGTKYRRLALQTRKSNYDISNTMQKAMLTLNTTLLNQNQRRAASNEFYSGQTPLGQRSLSTSEISRNVPLDQITSGIKPLQVNEKGIPVVGFDPSGREVMVDSAGNSLVTKKPDGSWYINPAADVITTLYLQNPNQLRSLAIQNVNFNPITSQDGTRIHPEYQKNLQLALRGNINPQNSFYYFQQLSMVDPKALRNLVDEPGNSDFTNIDSSILSVIQALVSNSATPPQIERVIQEFEVRKEDVKRVYKVFEDLRFNSSRTIEFQGQREIPEDYKDVLTAANAVVTWLQTRINEPGFQEEYGLSTDKFKDGGGKNATLQDLIENNQIFKAMVTRAFIAVQNNPRIPTIQGQERRTEIANFIPGFLENEFNHAQFSFVEGKLVQGSSVKNFMDDSTIDSMMRNLRGLPSEQQETIRSQLAALTNKERLETAASAGLLGYYNSGIIPQNLDPRTQEVTGDSAEIIREKAIKFIRTVNSKADLNLASIFIRNLSDTQLTRTGLTTSTNALNDATLIRIAFAVDPSLHEDILRDNAYVAFDKLTEEQQLQRAVDSFKRLPSSEYWNWRLDTFDVDTMETPNLENQRGGIPLGIVSIPLLDENGIPLKDDTGKVITFQPVTKDSLSSNGSYIPRYSNQAGIVQPSILMGGLQTTDFPKYFINKGEENFGHLPAVRNSLLFPAGVSSSSKQQTTEFLRNPYFWNEITENTLDYRADLFKQFLASEKIDNKEITSAGRLVTLLEIYPTLLSQLAAGDFYFRDIPDPVITRAAQHFADDKGLFSKDVMNTVFEKGKSLGLKTFDQYLSLMFTVASEYSDNRQYDFGYNFREAVKDPNFDVNNPPNRMPMGSAKQGLILYTPTSGSFSNVGAELISQGYNIYQSKTNPNEFYAFSSDEFAENSVENLNNFSPVYITRYKADEQQKSEDISLPTSQTKGKNQTVPGLPGWYGWSPSTVISGAAQPSKEISEGTFVGPPDTTGAAEEFLSEWKTRKDKLFGASRDDQQDAMFSDLFKNMDKQKKSSYTKPPVGNLKRQWQNFKNKISTILPDIKQGLDKMENWKQETPVGELEQSRIQSARDAGRLVREFLERAKGEPLGTYNPVTGKGGIEGLLPQPQQLLTLPLVPMLFMFDNLKSKQDSNNKLSEELQETIDAIKNNTLTKEEQKVLDSMSKILNNLPPSKDTSVTKEIGSFGMIGEKNNPDVEEATVKVVESRFPSVWNPDGSISSIKTISFQETKNGPHILIPTIKNGKVMTDAEAIAEYRKTKEHFGIFSTVEKANKQAKELHDIEEAKGKQIEQGWMAIINASEGMETKAYNKDGKWTIGKGSTIHPDGRPVKKGDVIAPEQADLYARHYVYTRVVPQLRISIPTWYEMNSNQQAAIISFAYNVGEYFYNRTGFETITKALKTKNNWGLVPSALPLYNKGMNLKTGKKEVLNGLIKRRQKEAELWLQAPTTILEGK